LVEADGYRAVVVGLEAGQRIPPHPSSAAAYHFLEGTGWMHVDGQRLPVETGATVVVPAGLPRGVEAGTRLAFLGSHGAPAQPQHHAPRRPAWMLALMGFFGLLVMGGLMALMVNPMAQMLASMGDAGLGLWATMALPFAGLLGMVVMMGVMLRRITTGNAGRARHSHHHISSASQAQGSESLAAENADSTITYTILAISCGGCAETIERALGEIEGIGSVAVDVAAKRATILYADPATPAGIEAALTEIGYPPEGR
jgi:copper chaperone CopZ